jgi:hypothetical protein
MDKCDDASILENLLHPVGRGLASIHQVWDADGCKVHPYWSKKIETSIKVYQQ